MKKDRGQSLVEMAIVAPLLLIMLLGLFEVGYALRNYMVLLNANREAARYGAKASGLDFDGMTPQQIGYSDVISHHLVVISDLLPNFQPGVNGTSIVISLYRIYTGWPCNPADKADPLYQDGQLVDAWPNCNCAIAQFNPWETPLLNHPGLNAYMQYAAPPTTASRIDPWEMADRLARQNIQLECSGMKSLGLNYLPAAHQVVVVETSYDHRQILGVPFISNRLTDPVPFYVKTVMRHAPARDLHSTPTPEPDE